MTKSDFDALKQYINTLTNEELNELQERKLRAEVEGIEIDNQLKKIEAIDKLSQMVKDGMLSIDNNFETLINGIPFILKKDNQLIKGGNMNEIDSADLTEEEK